eukprot:445740_1
MEPTRCRVDKSDLYRKIMFYWLVCEQTRTQKEIKIPKDIVQMVHKYCSFTLRFVNIEDTSDLFLSNEPNVMQFDTMYMRWKYVTFGTKDIIFEWVNDPIKPNYDEEIIISCTILDNPDEYIDSQNCCCYFGFIVIGDLVQNMDIINIIHQYYYLKKVIGTTNNSYALCGNNNQFGNSGEWFKNQLQWNNCHIQENDTVYIKFYYDSQKGQTDAYFAIKQNEYIETHHIDLDNVHLPKYLQMLEIKLFQQCLS